MNKTSSLLDIFTDRPYRYKLLDKGMELILSDNMKNHKINIMEIGCAYGDGAAHLAKTYNCCVIGVDITVNLIEDALIRHKELISEGVIDFQVGNAENLAFEDETFDVLVSEAAFSSMANKGAAKNEYYRVLKKGGFMIVNDFAIKIPVSHNQREEVDYIPCFSGVDTMEKYKELFESSGFNIVSIKEEYGELINISLWLSKVYEISIKEIGGYLSKYYNNGLGCQRTSQRKNVFFNEAKLTYCQMILKK